MRILFTEQDNLTLISEESLLAWSDGSKLHILGAGESQITVSLQSEAAADQAIVGLFRFEFVDLRPVQGVSS